MGETCERTPRAGAGLAKADPAEYSSGRGQCALENPLLDQFLLLDWRCEKRARRVHLWGPALGVNLAWTVMAAS